MKGNALAGAAAGLVDSGYRFHRLAGTSAGSMVAVLLAAGIDPTRLHDLMLTLDYDELLDASRLDRLHLGRVGIALSELVDGGIYRGDSLRSTVAGWLSELGVSTFGDLRLDDPGLDPNVPLDRRYKVVMIASDLTRQAMARIPWDLRGAYGIDPDSFPVPDAVRMSTAIPFFYMPEALRSRLTGQDSLMVDGGITSSFPVHVFDRTDGRPARWPTFHVALATARRPGDPVRELHGRVDVVRALVDTAMHGRINAERGDTDIALRTMAVDTSYVSSTDFSIDRHTRQRLFDDGYAAAKQFLQTWEQTARDIGVTAPR